MTPSRPLPMITMQFLRFKVEISAGTLDRMIHQEDRCIFQYIDDSISSVKPDHFLPLRIISRPNTLSITVLYIIFQSMSSYLNSQNKCLGKLGLPVTSGYVFCHCIELSY